MQRLSVNMKLGILAVAIGVAGMFAYQGHAIRTLAAQLSPAVVVTINIEDVFKGINVAKAEDVRVETLAKGLADQVKAQDTTIKDMEADLEALAPETPKYQEAMERYELAALDFRAFVEFSRQKVDIEQAISLRQIYRSIKKAAEDMSIEQGYDIVFLDDSIGDIPQATEEETNRQISARRMLFTSDRIDVTQELILRMNGGAPAPIAAGN